MFSTLYSIRLHVSSHVVEIFPCMYIYAVDAIDAVDAFSVFNRLRYFQ